MRKYRIKPRFYIFICLLMVICFGASFLMSKSRLSAEQRALDETLARRTEIANEIALLREELDYASTDAYIERSARDKLGMLYPGEYRYVAN